MSSRLLLLVHRIPFPPNKGDKIRSFHLLRHLAARHVVFLGAFVDDTHDWQYEANLTGLCREVKLVGLSPARRKFASLSGFLSGEPLSLPYYRNAALQHWVNDTISRHAIDKVVVFSSTMAQFVSGSKYAQLRRVADLCDVDSDKWRQYAEGRSLPMRWVYQREARQLLAYERKVAAEFDASLFVTRAEAELFKTLAPESADRVDHFDNGVDTDYFDPELDHVSPYQTPAPRVVFTGAMDYWANVDAVQWFVDEVWPAVRASCPTAEFFIVGSNPGPAVRALAAKPGVSMTGRVPDVRPYLAYADVAVAPLRIARGTQNKVLEALAMARPVVCTPAAAAGLRVGPGAGLHIVDAPADFARAVLALANQGPNREGRMEILREYSWDANLATVDRCLER